MADLDHPTIVVDNNNKNNDDDDRPLSVRRQRRSSAGLKASSSSPRRLPRVYGIATPPQTPKRSKKKVRFSDSDLDPGVAAIASSSSDYSPSGLTPFIRRTTLSISSRKPKQPRGSQSRRRLSTSSSLSSTPGRRLWQGDGGTPAASGTLQFAPLRQVLAGRVQRRLRRNGLSEEVNIIEWDRRREAKKRREEVERLTEELALKDVEVRSLRHDNADMMASQLGSGSGVRGLAGPDTTAAKVLVLEREIRFLKEELRRREQDGDTVVVVAEEGEAEETEVDWTVAARDPYAVDDFDDVDDVDVDDGDDGDEMMITNYDQDDGFQDMSGQDEIMTTPTRLNTSFLSPPSTMPNTPCNLAAGTQHSLPPIPDPENASLEGQLLNLQEEIQKLNRAIALQEDHHDRLAQKLSPFLTSDESPDHTALDSALDTVLTSLALSESRSLEHETAFSALATEISALGFSRPGCSPDAALESIASRFRQARLELEYLSPGETPTGFANDQLLGLLVSRVRVLMEKVKARDASIDQYHAQEVLLRQQLNDRVSVLDTVKAELSLATRVVGDLRAELDEQAVDGERLRAALDGYRDEVAGLERLIERIANEDGLRGEIRALQRRMMENDETQPQQQQQQQHEEATHACNAGTDTEMLLLAEFEQRFTGAQHAAAGLRAELAALAASQAATVAEKDAAIEQVSTLRGELERVNGSLQTAHATILSLRSENRELAGTVSRGRFVVTDMLKQLGRAQEMGAGFLDADLGVGGDFDGEGAAGETGLVRGDRAQSESPAVAAVVGANGGLFDAGLARRGSRGEGVDGGKRKKRRYDSGLGFLAEEDEEGE
ncbi:uncharacterized protein L3040_003590 [Drepanopeziza brunnea f. sp. 'multigermtubi']|uniref:uncharacterized protein n=1 Tax=Drepanopeziza brunnea f. sp. 'multigermtubi' TaxID=698441 RepID=UPI002382DE81|nr:hypothetical protein L3040_003590 [Drepanopeziza brunnea f. sp. 'multigermtubi']